MNSTLKDRYLAHYLPLVRDFVQEVDALGLDLAPKVAQPFLPLFGEGYERSALRMVIVGQDTKYWGCLKTFLQTEKTNPGVNLEQNLAEFRAHLFTSWGATRYTFWGFAMMFLAALHGKPDWGVMKRGAHAEILSSFAWGNGNAIEYHGSSPKHMPWEKWELVRRAGARFDGLHHLIEALSPRVVVVLWKDMHPPSYFAGYEYSQTEEQEGVRHYRINTADLDVLHVPHPGRMRWESTPAEDYCARLVGQLQSRKLDVAFPAFVQQHTDSENVVEHLRKAAPRRDDQFDKFKLVEWVAEELKKRGSFMSVPTLCDLLNGLGYTTNYGTAFSGGRGSYRLISGTYHRLEHAGRGDRARMVAEAFRRPNFEYAYEE